MYSMGEIVKLITLLLALSLLSFWLVSHSPIDPVQAYVGADMLKVGPEQREKIAEHWGLNKPKTEQYLHWAKAMISGDI